MQHAMQSPPSLPDSRVLGRADDARLRLLTCIDVVVGYVCARHRQALVGWHVEAALVESRPAFRGGETVAIRIWPEGGCSPADLPPVPFGVLREIASRCGHGLEGIVHVVPDIASTAPDVDGLFVVIDEEPWLEDAG